MDNVCFRSTRGRFSRVILEAVSVLATFEKSSLPNTRVYADVSVRDRTVLSLKNVSAAALDVPSELLTEQFIQGERSRVTDGNGLGLYIAKSLLELMNGSLKIAVTGDLFEAVISLISLPTAANSNL